MGRECGAAQREVTPLSVLDHVRPWRVLDRPVLVLAAPRSGSTFLFDVLKEHPSLVSWPFEAERAFLTAQPKGHPMARGHRWLPDYADEQVRRTLSRELYLGRLRARRLHALPVGRLERLALRPVRFLEKTPQNVLRIGALARLYPDAPLVFLHRDAPANIGSLLESWRTPSAAHARLEVDGRTVEWMMIAPPGWLEMTHEPAPVKAAFQWRAATEFALEDLAGIDPARVVRVAYERLVADPEPEIRRVLEHCELPPSDEVLAAAAAAGGKGRTSFSAPRTGKWREQADEIEPLLPELAPLREALGYEV